MFFFLPQWMEFSQLSWSWTQYQRKFHPRWNVIEISRKSNILALRKITVSEINIYAASSHFLFMKSWHLMWFSQDRVNSVTCHIKWFTYTIHLHLHHIYIIFITIIKHACLSLAVFWIRWETCTITCSLYKYFRHDLTYMSKCKLSFQQRSLQLVPSIFGAWKFNGWKTQMSSHVSKFLAWSWCMVWS